ncbi:MAG TPA: hypothetical protein H9964_00035 [Candidatus Gallimonas intestinavium]|uniref:Uncharacterized protein n=1 Tax=Candidatus Gallimonas intestinavium TaxID=2838603 RepID=A0A9D2G443_9FIRM|nr:hypothetical protein [Candidatus Gallimonas intestinavium]
MHTFFINTSKTEFKPYDVLFDIHLENKTLVTMQCPLGDWWDEEKGYRACVKTMAGMIDGYVELNNAFNVILYVDLTENAGYTAIPRDPMNQREREEYCEALQRIYRYLFLQSMTHDLIEEGREPKSVLIMFGVDKKHEHGGVVKDAPAPEGINSDLLKLLGIREDAAAEPAGSESGGKAAEPADEIGAKAEAMYRELLELRKQALPAGLNDEFLKDILREWCQTAVQSGVQAASQRVVNLFRDTARENARRASLCMVSAPYDYVAARFDKCIRAMSLLNIAIHLLKCVESNSIYEESADDANGKPKPFITYNAKEIVDLLRKKQTLFSQKEREIKKLETQYTDLGLAPTLYKFDHEKFGLKENGERTDAGVRGVKKPLLETKDNFSDLCKEDEGAQKQGGSAGAQKQGGSDDLEKLIKDANRLKQEHHDFLDKLKRTADTVLSHYAGRSSENNPAMLTTGGYNYCADKKQREQATIETVKDSSETAYRSALREYMGFCARRTVTLTEIDDQYDWFIAKIKRIAQSLKKLKAVSVILLVAMVVIYIPFLVIQAGDIVRNVATMMVAAVSVLVPLVLTALILAVVAASEKKQYGKAWAQFESRSKSAMAGNKNAVEEYNFFLFSVIPALRWVYDYKLDVDYYYDCCIVAKAKLEHHRKKLSEREMAIGNIIADLDAGRGGESRPDGNGEGKPGTEIDYTKPFCTGEKNIAFYSVFTAETLNSLRK